MKSFSRELLIVTSLLFALAAPAEAIVYHGQPDLPLTASVVNAAGGAKNVSGTTLFVHLAGSAAPREEKRLIAAYDSFLVTQSLAILGYALSDTLRIATARNIALPRASIKATQRAELVRALYAAGTSSTGKWDVGYMLERLISHDIHHAVMHDIDRKFGRAANAQFHVILTQIMGDLHNAG